MRRVCVPLEANDSVEVCDSQYAPSIQPQPESAQPLQRCRLITSPVVVPIPRRLPPLPSTASENCAYTESLNFESPPAFRRNQT